MITTEEVGRRVCKALAAIEEKSKSMTGSVTAKAYAHRAEKLHAFIGTVIMTLASRGNSIEPEACSRTYAMMIMMLRHYGLSIPEPEEAAFLACPVTEEDLVYWSRARMCQVVAHVAGDLGSLVESAEPSDVCAALITSAVTLSLFCIMHGMNEQELINDIPADIEVRLG